MVWAALFGRSGICSTALVNGRCSVTVATLEFGCVVSEKRPGLHCPLNSGELADASARNDAGQRDPPAEQPCICGTKIIRLKFIADPAAGTGPTHHPRPAWGGLIPF